MAGGDLAAELRACGRAVMLSNHTMQLYADKASEDQMRFLVGLIHEELAFRDENKRRRLMKKASFPAAKSFENYEWGSVRLPTGLGIDDITTCDFVKDFKNLALFGPVGTGKTPMCIAIGTTACMAGLHVRFFSTSELVMRLSRAKDEGTLDKLFKDLQRADLIILDEFGYIPIDRDGARLLFQLVSDSYERRSLILTTNVEFSRWGTVLTDDQMAAAMIDRIAR